MDLEVRGETPWAHPPKNGPEVWEEVLGLDLEDYRFSAEHMWVRVDEDQQAFIGLTEEALQDKDEVTRLRLPAEGEEFTKDEPFGRLTAKRTVIRLFAPISGEVVEVNEEVLDAPEMVLEDPYEEGWLLRVDIIDMAEVDELMSREEYEDYLSEDFPDEDEDIESEEEEEYDEDDEEDEY
jgi:glycine cleavage system H protein